MRKQKPDKEKVAEIAFRYESGESASDLASELGVVPETIWRWLKESGYRVRTREEAKRPVYPLREDAFDSVTEESAYWVGFLMADGCVHEKNGIPSSVSLSLTYSDVDHIEKLREFLGSKNQITISPSKIMTNGYMANPSAKFGVRSRKIAEALCSYGVTPRKSSTAKVVGLEMDRHFWRGVIDGDGSVLIDKSNRASLELGGSEPLTNQFAAFVRTIAPNCVAMPTQRPGMFRFALSSHNAFLVIKELYEDCSIALGRKIATAKSIIENPDQYSRHLNDRRSLTKEELNSLFKSEGSWRRVADRLGLSPGSLYQLRHERGYENSDRPSKLKPEDIPAIWQRLCEGDSGSQIAREYQVSPMTISMIRNGDRWQRITSTLPGKPK